MIEDAIVQMQASGPEAKRKRSSREQPLSCMVRPLVVISCKKAIALPRGEGRSFKIACRPFAYPSMLHPSRYALPMNWFASGVSGLVPVLPSYWIFFPIR